MGSEQRGIYFSRTNMLVIAGFIAGSVVWGIDIEKRVIANSTNIENMSGQISLDRTQAKEARDDIKKQLLGIDQKLDALLLHSNKRGF